MPSSSDATSSTPSPIPFRATPVPFTSTAAISFVPTDEANGIRKRCSSSRGTWSGRNAGSRRPARVGPSGTEGDSPGRDRGKSAISLSRRWVLRRLPLFRCLELVDREHEVLLVERLVAVEASLEVSLVIDRAVGLEGSILPLAVAHLGGIFRTPAGTLLHDGDAGDLIGLDEAAVAVLLRLSVGTELGLVVDHGDDGSARQWLPGFHLVEREPGNE